ncbi:MAG: HIT domain-containing protein [Dehalococcoidia bacterium]
MSDCLFCGMAEGEIPVERLAENDKAFAIRDIHPRAPTHLLVVPKLHIDSAAEIEVEHGDVLTGMFVLAAEAAKLVGVADAGYRLAFNVGDAAGMTIHHLHLHLLGGRPLGPEG